MSLGRVLGVYIKYEMSPFDITLFMPSSGFKLILWFFVEFSTLLFNFSVSVFRLHTTAHHRHDLSQQAQFE